MGAIIDAETHLPPTPTSVHAAREFVDSTLGSWHAGAVADVVRLLTSELVTNTVVHANSDIDLRVHLDQERVRIEVEDADDHLPNPSHPRADATSGRGLQIVSGLAAAWGVRPRDGGKVVWFEVPTTASV